MAIEGLDYFLEPFLSCFGFLTSFLRTLFPLPMTDSFKVQPDAYRVTRLKLHKTI